MAESSSKEEYQRNWEQSEACRRGALTETMEQWWIRIVSKYLEEYEWSLSHDLAAFVIKATDEDENKRYIHDLSSKRFFTASYKACVFGSKMEIHGSNGLVLLLGESKVTVRADGVEYPIRFIKPTLPGRTVR